MDYSIWMEQYWQCVADQDREGLRRFFWPEARIRWFCSGEEFTAEEFIRANCEYPGAWRGHIERMEVLGERVITAVRVWSEERSCHVCSFFTVEQGKIRELDEYWGDDGPAPDWRQKLHIGRPVCTDQAE